MTKRIALSMLLTVWAILIAADVTAYFTTRSVLLANLDAALVARATPLGPGDRFVVKNDIGQTLLSQANDDNVKSAQAELLHAGFVTLGDGQRVRTVTVRVHPTDSGADSKPMTVTLSASTAPLDGLLKRLMWALIVTGCGGGIVAAVVARMVATIALRPLRSTAQTIGAIDEQNLSRRIDASRLAPELAPVAECLNEMLARLETSFANRKQFLADASHELRTPVAAIVTTLEVSLRRLRDIESYRQTMQTCLADATLMRKLVDGLMAQARSEIGAFDEPAEAVDVSALLNECAAIMQATAEQRGISIARSIDEPIVADVPPARLRSAVMGLLENAIDHNRPGGSVELAASLNKSRLQIAVRDTGPGIAAEHLPHLFEPFYRASKSRDVSGHMGLGLYLVKSHVAAMGGSCAARSELGAGSTFEIVLPVTSVPQKLAETAVAS